MKQKCRKCGAKRELTEFHKDRHSSTGHRAICKSCVSGENKKFWKIGKIKRAQQERIKNSFGSFDNVAMRERVFRDSCIISIDKAV